MSSDQPRHGEQSGFTSLSSETLQSSGQRLDDQPRLELY